MIDVGRARFFSKICMTALVNFPGVYSLWELFVFILPEDNYWPTVSWAIAWFLGSLQAHWTHRIWTFDSDRDIKWTIPQPWLCTLSEEWVQPLVTTWNSCLGIDERITFLINSSLWGFLNYLGQREMHSKKSILLTLQKTNDFLNKSCLWPFCKS